MQREQSIAETLRENGVEDASGVIRALLWMLEKHHVDVIGLRRLGSFSDGLDRKTGGHAKSLAESIRNYAAALALETAQMSKYRRAQGKSEDDQDLASLASALESLVDVLDQLLPAWEKDGNLLRAKGFRSEVCK